MHALQTSLYPCRFDFSVWRNILSNIRFIKIKKKKEKLHKISITAVMFKRA